MMPRIFTLLLYTVMSAVAATPQVSSVSGPVHEGSSVLIRGSGFGTEGPTIVLFEDFNRGTSGDTISLEATWGNWYSHSAYYLPYFAEDENGNIAGHLIKNDTTRQLCVTFDDVQEIFLSYRVSIPRGSHFPNANAPATFPDGSQWKLVWLMDGDRGAAGNDDLVLPTWGNGTNFSVAGNDNACQLKVGRPGSENNWFSFKGWNRFSIYMKGGEIPDCDPGVIWAQGMSVELGQHQFYDEPILFDGDDSPDSYQFEDDSISRWNCLKIPGWHRSGDSASNALYDDIYLATGDGARARVEIGDHPLYDSCSRLALSTPTSWSDSLISITVHHSLYNRDSTAYLFVFNSDGVVQPEGTPIVITDETSPVSSEIHPHHGSSVPEMSVVTSLNNTCTVHASSPITAIQVNDLMGRVVYETATPALSKISFTPGTIASGVYCLTVTTVRGAITEQFLLP